MLAHGAKHEVANLMGEKDQIVIWVSVDAPATARL